MASTHVLTKGDTHEEWGRDTLYNCNDTAAALSSASGITFMVWRKKDYERRKLLPTGQLPQHEQVHPVAVWKHGQQLK